jgi:transposase
LGKCSLRVRMREVSRIKYYKNVQIWHLTSGDYPLIGTKPFRLKFPRSCWYHTSAATQAFLAAHRDRITAEPLPSYSPDYNPIEFLWKKTKQRATHNQYFKEFIALTVSVDKALAYFATHPDTVLGLCGRYCEESGLKLKQAA